MAQIVLCCGKVCSGKSTFARSLKERYGFYHFSADDWMLHFYEETSDRGLFDSRLKKCIAMINSLAEVILSHGDHVVLDFGFWTRSDRVLTKDRYESLGHSVSVVYFPIDLETQIEYMNKRQKTNTEVHYKFDQAVVETLNRYFEEPAEDEKAMPTKDFDTAGQGLGVGFRRLFPELLPRVP